MANTNTTWRTKCLVEAWYNNSGKQGDESGHNKAEFGLNRVENSLNEGELSRNKIENNLNKAEIGLLSLNQPKAA